MMKKDLGFFPIHPTRSVQEKDHTYNDRGESRSEFELKGRS